MVTVDAVDPDPIKSETLLMTGSGWNNLSASGSCLFTHGSVKLWFYFYGCFLKWPYSSYITYGTVHIVEKLQSVAAPQKIKNALFFLLAWSSEYV